MDVKELEKKLDNNLFTEKHFKKIYLVYAILVVLTPILETSFYCIGIAFNTIFQIMLLSTMFAITKIVELAFNYKKITIKNKTGIDLLVLCLLVWFLIASVANGSFNTNFFFVICYFLTFALFLSVDSKKYRLLLSIFAIEMIVDSILGIIDLHNTIIPGFESGGFVMSLQFGNPNWSGFVMILAAMAILWLILTSEKNWLKSLGFVGFSILVLGLFIGGSYAPEFSLFLCELAVVVYLWIKNKKCPFWVLGALGYTIFISFFVWAIPEFRSVTTAGANFFYESLAVIDGKLGTKLLKNVSGFFNKLFGGNSIQSVAGSDGWGRDDLKAMAFDAIFKNAKSFMFGYGSAYIYTIRVHNCYIVLWLEFGLPELLLYVAILVCLLVRFIRVQKSEKSIIMFMTLVMMLIEKLFCCIEPYCYGFFVMLVAILYKELYSLPLKDKTLKENCDEQSNLKSSDMLGEKLESD